MDKPVIIVIGIGGDELPAAHIDEHSEKCSAIVASESVIERLKKYIRDGRGEKQWIPIAPVSRALDSISNIICSRSVLIFTSGDPLFFGLGKMLTNRFPDTDIVFLPALSSLQICCARFAIPWNDATFLSLHGRPFSDLNKFLHCSKLFILTDQTNSPQKIAGHLISLLPTEEQNKYRMYIGVKLGTKNEKLCSGSLQTISRKTFAQPNCLILLRTGNTHETPYGFGLHEDEIRHSRGLITKNEVRAAVIHALRLPANGVFWDIGAGSGSVSIEAALSKPGLSVYAVEQKQQEIDNITANRNHYKCWNISIHHGRAPDILGMLPAPDCIFIGGSGGALSEIITYISDKNLCAERIVITAVIKETIETAPELFYRSGYRVSVSVVSTSRYTHPPSQQVQFNPIHIIQAVRCHE
ncbi:MAG: precorrin-6y C5,15-methyltransferase (decarboxylating) subunit CbiE [Desulfocapsaceae bacterium]|jgi:precorrin-6Y C5,15-methyltransferase (decarboxylating)|nr:precorrin-6y C5,15-methyltransferase (decarboxylating) subunit CbiE [Desulfocapsaceae bacterium]